MRNCRFIVVLLSILIASATLAFGGLSTIKDNEGKDCHIVAPDGVPGDKKLWVVVHVHGAGGLKSSRGAEGLAKLLGGDGVIAIAPSFASGYQMGNGPYAEKLIDLFQKLQKTHNVHDKMFLHGFSGGGQFVHRFTMNHPKLVAGASAHSSGSWATGGGFGDISSRAKGVPFAISCGEKDTSYSVAGYPHTRIEWYHEFAKQMKQQHFAFKGATWPGVGHSESNGAREMARECFLLATTGTLASPSVNGNPGADDQALKEIDIQNRPHRNSKASGSFDDTGIKREGQFEPRFPYVVSQIALKLAPFGSGANLDKIQRSLRSAEADKGGLSVANTWSFTLRRPRPWFPVRRARFQGRSRAPSSCLPQP